jgi:hypothetical protein
MNLLVVVETLNGTLILILRREPRANSGQPTARFYIFRQDSYLFASGAQGPTPMAD